MKIRVRKSVLMLIVYSFLVLFISYFTYFRDYWYPANLFWDENYHIASSYKYINNVMFMEPHPPLGKFFIALGEYLFHPNSKIDTQSFLSVDYIKAIPSGFSFVGVRFFLVLFATLSAVLVFFSLYKISRDTFLSFLFTSFYLFENALIVHSRGVMLEGVQLFFVLGVILYFFYLLGCIDRTGNLTGYRQYFWFGFLVGLTVSVKLNGGIVALLFFPLFFYRRKFTVLGMMLRNFFLSVGVFTFGAILVFCGVYYVHVLFGQRILGDTSYLASEEYKRILYDKQLANPLFFPILLKDNLLFIEHYESGVPKYDPTKRDENGSLPYTWAFGNKSINYRWESNDGLVRYLYLQGNPFIWLAGLLGVVLSFCLVVSAIIFRLPIRNRRVFFLIAVFLSLYIIYMGSMVVMDRVLYLYHYFIPLLFSLFLFFLVYLYVFEEDLKKNGVLFLCTVLFMVLVVFGFWFFSPLTYYQPISERDFLMRSWLPFWGLKPV